MELTLKDDFITTKNGIIGLSSGIEFQFVNGTREVIIEKCHLISPTTANSYRADNMNDAEYLGSAHIITHNGALYWDY